MARPARIKRPIMTPEQERFMSFEGLLQWTQAVVRQSERLTALDVQSRARWERRPERFSVEDQRARVDAMHEEILARHTESHFFAIAASKLIEHRRWVESFGLCANVDFSEIDGFSVQDIKDVRDMREHVKDYFQGEGKFPDRWRTPDGTADASSLNGTKIGGRLDWVAFGAAAKRLLPRLLAEPIPFPPAPLG
jgi:hypothetical protein